MFPLLRTPVFREVISLLAALSKSLRCGVPRFARPLALVLGTTCLQAETPADYAVQLSAAIQRSPPAIRLNWLPSDDAIRYTIYRKMPDDRSWGAGIPLDALAKEFVDNAVLAGTEYEYGVVKATQAYTGYGFISAGIDTPLVEHRGKLILIVDRTQAGPLAGELARLQQDLAGDGWTVIRHDVSRDASVAFVKERIVSDYNSDRPKVRAVFLFGHVPVPYSGFFAPDGHPGHFGAWPADLYYGNIGGTWTDTTADNSTPSDPRNSNTPGDGKFDQNSIPSDVRLQVGRVDLADMPSFAKSETELLRQYLNKDHDFRHKRIAPQPLGLIDDEFGTFETETFAADGWRNFSSLLGAGNVIAQDWFPILSQQSYLWAYGCGIGTYTSVGNIANTPISSRPRQVAAATGTPSRLAISLGAKWRPQNARIASRRASCSSSKRKSIAAPHSLHREMSR